MISLILVFFLGQETGMTPRQVATQHNVWVSTNGNVASGVIIQDGFVLTNFHVLEVDSNIRVDGQKAQIVAVDTKHDLVLLKVFLFRHVVPVTFGNEVSVDDEIFYVANTNGHKNFMSRGRVNFIDNHYFYTDVIAVEGCSGGGVYNLAGELVGINDAHEFHSIGLHVHITTVLSFLELHKELMK